MQGRFLIVMRHFGWLYRWPRGSRISLRSSLVLQKQSSFLPKYSTQDGVISEGHSDWAPVDPGIPLPDDAQPATNRMSTNGVPMWNLCVIPDMLM